MRPRTKPKRITTKAKKSATTSEFKKQKTMVKTRLMQISLRLDDHIYKNKQISAQNAELYIQEIAALKQQCHLDIPSLQVVEKLTRIMGAITEGGAHIEDTHSNSMTPVSSLPDIDGLTSQRLNSEDQGINSQNISEPNNHFTLEPINTSDDNTVKIVAATGSDATEFLELTQNVNVVDITRAISTLSVYDESSLNLLDKYSSDGVMNNCGQGIEEYNRALTNTTTPIVKQIIKEKSQNKSNKANASMNRDNRKEFSRKLVTRREQCVTKIRNKNDNNHQSQAQKPTKRRAKTSIVQKTKITNYFDKENQAKPDQPKEIPKKKKATTFVPPMKENKTVIVSNKENENVLPTEPSKVEIDLSWVENLKYVRQINVDEFSSMDGINESFWKNCEFPEKFDETVFNCS